MKVRVSFEMELPIPELDTETAASLKGVLGAMGATSVTLEAV